MLTWADKWLVGFVSIVALAGCVFSWLLLPLSGNQLAEIRVNGQLVKTLRLQPGYHEEYRVGDDKNYNIIEAQDGKIRIRDADCPDQICVHTGWVKSYPQQIVCLPFHVVVKVVSAGTGDIDDISR